jgi:hypothetical protein
MQKFGEKREECLRDFRNAQAFLQKAVLMNDEFAQTSGTGVVPASVSTYVKLPPPQVIEGALGIELDPAVVTAKEVAEKEICNATLKYLSVFYGAQLTSIRELLKIPTASEAFASSLKEYSARIISDAGGADTAIWNPVIERIKAALVTELESLNYEYMATLIRDAQAKEVKANAV